LRFLSFHHLSFIITASHLQVTDEQGAERAEKTPLANGFNHVPAQQELSPIRHLFCFSDYARRCESNNPEPEKNP
jgi:hypothetical protein